MSDKHLKRRHKKKNAAPSCRKIIRWPRLLEIIPLGKTPIYDQLINTGRLRPVPLGPRAVGFVEDEALAIVDELIAARDASGTSAEEAVSKKKTAEAVS